MLPKQHRLRRQSDFGRVRRYGRSAGGPLIALYVLPTRTPDIRIGFSVSKRVGKATVRNYVKRLIREAVRHELPTLRTGQDLVFVARPAAAHADYPHIREGVRTLLRKTGAAQTVGVRNG